MLGRELVVFFLDLGGLSLGLNNEIVVPLLGLIKLLLVLLLSHGHLSLVVVDLLEHFILQSLDFAHPVALDGLLVVQLGLQLLLEIFLFLGQLLDIQLHVVELGSQL